MEKLTINAVKRIAINDDESRIIEFDPTDMLFIERFYKIYGELEAKNEEYQAYLKKLDEESGGDTLKNFGESIRYLKETCLYLREKIDQLFGKGTSQKAFDNSLSFDMIAQFFEGIMPYLWQERTQKVNKYSGKNNSHVMK